MENHGGLKADKGDDRDYSAEHILGINKQEVPNHVDLSCIAPMNQGRTAHCTAYGLTMVHSILQTMEAEKNKPLNPEEQWNNQKLYPGTATESDGDYLRSALKSLKRYGLTNPHVEKPLMYLLDGYAIVKRNAEAMCEMIAKGLPIYTGGPVTKTNFYNAKHKGYWSGLDGVKTGGHAFAIIGYNKSKEYFIAINSWGDKWGAYKNGTFRIKFSEIKDLYSMYILFDKKDAKLIYKDVTEESPMAEAIKFCLENGYIRGYGDEIDSKDRYFKPNQPVTRAEMAQIIHNFKK